jgi:hypothetical protein
METIWPKITLRVHYVADEVQVVLIILCPSTCEGIAYFWRISAQVMMSIYVSSASNANRK